MNQISAKKTVDSKRGHPSPSAAKGQADSPGRTYATGGSLAADLVVLRATDLGQGYVLIEVKERDHGKSGPVAKRDAPAAPLTANLPEIPEKDVKALLKELAQRDTNSTAQSRLESETRPNSRSEPAGVPDDNQAFMDKLYQQSLASRARQVEDGLLLTSSDICSRRQITRQALSRAVKDGRVFWLDGPSGTQLYPHFFAKSKLERSAFEKVSRALGAVPGASKWQFFTTPKRSLGGISPVEALDKGAMESVMATAMAFRER